MASLYELKQNTRKIILYKGKKSSNVFAYKTTNDFLFIIDNNKEFFVFKSKKLINKIFGNKDDFYIKLSDKYFLVSNRLLGNFILNLNMKKEIKKLSDYIKNNKNDYSKRFKYYKISSTIKENLFEKGMKK